MHKPFSYLEYQSIIENISSHNTIMDFSQVSDDMNQYCVIRHDVEFSVDRALNLALFESNSINIQTSYLFQIRNNCYNLASDVNLKKIHKINDLGHKIGLHVHLGLFNESDSTAEYILNEVRLFESITGLKVDRFSYHRPKSEILERYLEIPNLINCYGKNFFHHYDIPHNNLDVKYFTDSRHQWHHGHPLQDHHNKVQLLTHPYSWSPSGNNNIENYRGLLKEKDRELRYSMERETSTFPEQFRN